MYKDRAEVSDNTKSWCRTLIGALNFLTKTSRWGIAHAVSRASQDTQQPKAGTVAAIEHIVGYLVQTVGFRIAGKRDTGTDSYVVYTDSDHHGDALSGTKSHTGVTVLLNGVTVFWGSNKQLRGTALSPMEAEICALSERVRDARDIAWTLEEMGC